MGTISTSAEMVPKQTFEPIEMILQAQNDELPEFYYDFHIEDRGPLDICSKEEFLFKLHG